MKKVEQILMRFPPFRWVLAKSRHIHPPGFEGLDLYSVMGFFISQVKNIGFSQRAAAISFNVLMALPAGLIFLCTLVPYLPSAIQVEKQLLTAVKDVLMDKKTYNLMAGIIHDFFNTQRSGLLSFSALAAIFFSSNAMMGIMRTFDRSYFEERSSKFLAKRGTAIKLTVLLVLFIICTVILISAQGPVKTFFLKKLHINTPTVRWIIQMSRWIILAILNFFTIATIYREAPAVKNRWRLASPGAILACFLTILTTVLFSFWVNEFGRFNEIYGSLGTVLILMNLLYINSLVLLIGFELNVSITAIKAKNLMAAQVEADKLKLAN